MNVVITGASRGIGKAIAVKYAAAGHTLFLCSRDAEKLKECCEELQNTYKTQIHYYPADLSKPQAAKDFGKWVLENTDTIDILINNAGQFIPGNIYNEEDGTLEKMIGINLYSAYNVTRSLLKSMMERKAGHIFNISSIAGLQAYPNGGAYSISKFALTGFSKNLREEMKGFNIKITTVYPGAVYTSSWDGSGVEKSRIIEVEDIANMIFAVSKLSPQACVEDIVIRPQLGDL